MLKEHSRPRGLRERVSDLVNPRSDSRTDQPTTSVNLPSQGVFYPDRRKSVKVSAFTIDQVVMLKSIDATSHESVREKILADVIGRSLADFDVLDLTVGDYVFLLYWIRLNSYKRSPFMLSWKGEDGIERSAMLQDTTLDVVEVDTARAVPRDFTYMTVRDKIKSLEIEDKALAWKARYASYLNLDGNLEARMEALGEMGPDKIVEINQNLEKFLHGVNELAVVQEGDKEIKIPMKLEISDFFP